MISTQPTAIGKITAFRENPLNVTLNITAPYTINGAVTVEVWTGGVLQTAINPTVTVNGLTITFQLTVAQLRTIGKNSYLYIKFGSLYVLGDVIEVVMTTAVPSSKVINVTMPGTGTVRVSAYSDQANASIAMAQATIATAKATQALQAAQDAQAAAATVQRTSGYYQQLVDASVADDDLDWQDTTPTVTSSAANGASINTTTRAINIPSGSSGSGSYIQKVIPLNNYENLAIGDTVQIRDIWLESPLASLGANDFTVSMAINGGTLTPATPLRSNDGSIIYYFSNYTLAALTDTVTIRYTVASGTRSTTTTFTWNTTQIIYDAKIYAQAASEIGEASYLSKSTFVPFIERSPRISKATGDGTTDDAARMQDEIYDAIATSGSYELRKDKVYKVLSKLTVNGGLHIYGYNRSGARINGDTAGMNVFEIDTVLPVWFENFDIGRSANVTATAVKWLSNVVNKDSVLERMKITSVKGLEVFNTDGLRVLMMDFVGPANPVTMDTNAAAGTVFNTLYDGCRFIDCDLNAFDIYSANNLTIANSRCRSTGATYINNFVRLSLNFAGVNEGLFMYGNQASDIQNNGLTASTGTNVFLKRVEVFDNTLKCQAAASGANCITLAATTSNGIEDVSIEQNKLYNKLYGVVGTNVKNLTFGGGRVIGDNTASSRALNLTNSSYLLYPAIRSGQAAADTFPGSTLLT